jgi:hypothetical protein
MRIAIMQPYLFPYVGYFQLLNSVNKFVFYDDVNYKVGGWISRNRIMTRSSIIYFSIPIKKASPNRKILKTEIDLSSYNNWKSKFYKTLIHSYKRSPHFYEVYNLISDVLDTKCSSISELSSLSVKKTAEYLGIKTEIISSATKYNNSTLEKTDRIIDICQKEGCNIYVNNQSGSNLYDPKYFYTKGITLNYLKPRIIPYQQQNNITFIKELSIIDILMNIDSCLINSDYLKCELS